MDSDDEEEYDEEKRKKKLKHPKLRKCVNYLKMKNIWLKIFCNAIVMNHEVLKEHNVTPQYVL